MATRLGLQIGTNSIGWCLFNGEAIQALGVRVFSDGRDSKTGASLAIDRRNARLIRRRRDRYVRRRSALLDALIATGLMPADTQDAKALAGCDPYALRADALAKALSPHLLGRALFHLNQRRGFKSDRKAARTAEDEAEGSKIADGTKALDAVIGSQTYGQFLNSQPIKRVRMRTDGSGYDFFPERRHLEAEFDAIWAAQAVHHPALLTAAVRNRLRRIIFFQRPRVPPKVGGCTFFNEEPRLPKAHPLVQERRLYEQVNQLEITRPGAPSRTLTLEERDKLVRKLRSAKTASFPVLAKLLKLAGSEGFSKVSGTRTGLVGDEVFASFSNKKCFGPKWALFELATQWSIVEVLRQEEDPVRLYDWLRATHGVDAEQAIAIGRLRLPVGTDRLGETASRKILAELKRNVVTYEGAVEAALGNLPREFRTGVILGQLPYYGEIVSREIATGSLDPGDATEVRWGKITNPTAHIALGQLRRLLGAIIAVHGRPAEIVVSLSRELKLSDKDKSELRKRAAFNARAAQARSNKLLDCGQRDSGANRELLKLWEELDPSSPIERCCPFCGGHIKGEALFTQSIGIALIIPYSRSFDESAANKVVAHRNCIKAKGNKTPWEAWGNTDLWAVIARQVSRLPRSMQWRFAPDAMTRFDKGSGAVARQLTETRYLSRIVQTYLSSLYAERSPDRLPGDGVKGVYVIPGLMTPKLRRLWHLNNLLPDHNYVENRHSAAAKNRLDHRHPAIDAAVVAATDRRLVNTISAIAGSAEVEHPDQLLDGLPEPWEAFREDLREAVSQVIVSHKVDHGRQGAPPKDRDMTAGRLHNETAYGLTGMVSAGGLPIVVRRVPLLSLKPADITDPIGIPDAALKRSLLTATEGLSGRDFELALGNFSKSDPVFMGIRHVRLREGLKVIEIRDASGHAYKAYKGDSNARFEVWQMPDGKWVSSWIDRNGIKHSGIISMFVAHQAVQPEQRPHPAAKKVLSLHINDLVAVEPHGQPRQIMRVVKFSSQGHVTFAEHQEAGPLKTRDLTSPEIDPFRYFYSSAGGLKKANARQIRIDELGRVFDPGPR